MYSIHGYCTEVDGIIIDHRCRVIVVIVLSHKHNNSRDKLERIVHSMNVIYACAVYYH